MIPLRHIVKGFGHSREDFDKAEQKSQPSSGEWLHLKVSRHNLLRLEPYPPVFVRRATVQAINSNPVISGNRKSSTT
jgi:hypothetical protein